MAFGMMRGNCNWRNLEKGFAVNKQVLELPRPDIQAGINNLINLLLNVSYWNLLTKLLILI